MVSYALDKNLVDVVKSMSQALAAPGRCDLFKVILPSIKLLFFSQNIIFLGWSCCTALAGLDFCGSK